MKNALRKAKMALRFLVSDDPPETLRSWVLGGSPSYTGAEVTPMSALNLSAVYSCVRVLSEDVGSLPLNLYEKILMAGEYRGRKIASNHQISRLLHLAPNPEMSSMQWREASMVHVLLWGNSYTEIERNRGGQIIGLWPITPWRVSPKRINGQIVYEVTNPAGGINIISSENMLHIRGFSLNGLTGLSAITASKEAVGMAMAGQEFAGRYFTNDTTAGVVLETPNALSDKAYERLKKSIESQSTGLSDKHRMQILEEGAKLNRLALNASDAQILESRRFSVEEVARMFRIPPHKIQDLNRATNNNIEQQDLDYFKSTLRPWLVRFETEYTLKLLLPSEQDRFFAKFVIEGFLRGDYKTRHEGYAQGIQNGIYTRNECRAFEDMNPIDGGDAFYMAANITELKPGRTAESNASGEK